MKHIPWKKAVSLFTGLALCLSLIAVPAMAAPAADAPASGASFVNISEDGGENVINLTQARSFKATVPVDLTEDEAKAAAESVVWSLNYDADAGYLDPELFPHHTDGGTLDTFKTQNDDPLFTKPVTGVEVVDGKVCLTVTFDSTVYFFNSDYDWYYNEEGGRYDPSAPHDEGGVYMDVCGYYKLTAADKDGKALGSVDVKIVPYDNFHTMKEVYATIDEMVDYAKANTKLYVQRFSMGKTQGDNGHEALDMPYLIIAKNQAAVDNWQKLKERAETDPSAVIKELEAGTLTDFQVPVLYSNVHTNEVSSTDGILKFAWMLLETAASKEGKIDYNNLTGFTEEGKAALAEQMGPKGEEDSVAIPDLVKDTATYLGFLKGEDSGSGEAKSGTVAPDLDFSNKLDLDKYYTQETVTVDVNELLDDVFFIIVPAENAEGRTYITRESSGGVDLNRDNSFQTQAETRNMTKLIADWNPVSFTEFHGRIEMFQCEPCDPPHEPNFEYDLLAEHLVSGGEALGIAAVANNDSYNSYAMPQRDYLLYTGEKTADGQDQTIWPSPWDDMSTSYTPQYAMLHGTVAYTVEQPAYNDQTATAIAYGQLAQSNYIAANKKGYLLNQTKIFERGVTNANSNAYELVGQWFCDVYDVEGAESETFRPVYDGEGQNGNFYPECYIIPLDGAHQKNLDAANQMVEYLIRNGVNVMIADKAFTYDGAEYPAGTAVVSMYQAKRSVANGMLYNGTVITGWPVLYSEGITAFNKTRGFDMATCAEPEAYKDIAAACTEKTTWDVASDKVDTEQVILRNTSEAAIVVVNKLLKDGKSVSLITEGDYTGSFLISKADYDSVSGEHLLTAAPVEGDAPAALVLTKAPVVYIAGKQPDSEAGFVHTDLINWNNTAYNFDRQSIRLMGFETTDDPAKADLILGMVALDDAALAAVKAGTPYIGYGSSAAQFAASNLFAEGELVWQKAARRAMDALGYVTYPTKSLITASYVSEGDDIMYGYGAGYFTKIPAGAKVLVRMDGSKELLEGFLPAGDGLEAFKDNSIQAFSYQQNGMDVVLFANTLTQKIHQRDEYTFIANAAFSAVADSFKDVAFDQWYFNDVYSVKDAGLMYGVSDNAFNPKGIVTREMVITTLYRAEGSPEVSGNELDAFADAGQIHDWAKDAMLWAVQEKILEGTGNSLEPRREANRQELAAIFYRYADAPEVDSNNLDSFTDRDSIANWATDAAEWCVSNEIIKGTSTTDNVFSPKTDSTRAQLATMLLRLPSAE